MTEKTTLSISGILLFVGGFALGVAATDPILRGIQLAVSPKAILAAGVLTANALPTQFGLTAGLFLAMPIFAIALARPLVPSLLRRGIAGYFLSALISACAGLLWMRWTASSEGSTLAWEQLYVVQVALAGPAVVVVLAGVLGNYLGPAWKKTPSP